MQTRRHIFTICLLAGLLLCFVFSAFAADEPTLKVGEFTFKAPAPWKNKETPRPMSQGGFSLPAADGKRTFDADFYHFGNGQGGDLEANVTRWKSQFQPAADGAPAKFSREEWTFGNRKVTLVFLQGTFLSGSPLGPKTAVAGSAMIGAVLDSDDGSVFVKFTGPEKEITENREAFMKLLGSAYPEAPTKVPAPSDEKAK